MNQLAAKALHTQPLGIGVTAVAGAARSFFMSHSASYAPVLPLKTSSSPPQGSLALEQAAKLLGLWLAASRLVRWTQ
jgi:hypothetical protein